MMPPHSAKTAKKWDKNIGCIMKKLQQNTVLAFLARFCLQHWFSTISIQWFWSDNNTHKKRVDCNKTDFTKKLGIVEDLSHHPGFSATLPWRQKSYPMPAMLELISDNWACQAARLTNLMAWLRCYSWPILISEY